MSSDGADCFDIIEGLQQRGMLLILEYIFDDLLGHDTATLISADQVSTCWRLVLRNWLKVFKKTFQIRVESDPLTRIISRRWKALELDFPHVVEAQTQADYRTLCQLMWKERQQLINNSWKRNKRRINVIDLTHFNEGLIHQIGYTFSCLGDDRLVVTAFTFPVDQVKILVWDRWTLALKHQLVRRYRAGFNTIIRWNDHFIASCTFKAVRLTVWDLDTGRLVFVLEDDSLLNQTHPMPRIGLRDMLINSDNVLVASFDPFGFAQIGSKLFCCRLINSPNGEEYSPPPEYRVIDFPSVRYINIFDMDRDVIILKTSQDYSQFIEERNLFTVQIRSTIPPYDLINERENVNPCLNCRTFDRSWILLQTISGEFEIWNFRTGQSHTLIETYGNALCSRSHFRYEIVSEYHDAGDQKFQWKLNNLLSPNVDDVRLTLNTTSCVWWKKHIEVYTGRNLFKAFKDKSGMVTRVEIYDHFD